MILLASKLGEAKKLTNISIRAFHSDVLIGGEPNDGPPDYDSVEWHREMRAKGQLFSYFDDEGNLVGGAVLVFKSKKIHIDRIFIHPKYFRKGYGMKLLQEIEIKFPEVTLITLDTPLDNIRTNSLYKKMGYVETNRTEDVISYEKRIPLLKMIRMSKNDFYGLYDLLSNPEVMKYLEPPYDVKKAEEFLLNYGLKDIPLVYSVLDDDDQFIGYVNFHEYDETGYEIGWVLKPEHWNKGYATKLTQKLIDRCIDLNKDAIIECDREQIAAIKIATKYKFKYIGHEEGRDIYRLQLHKKLRRKERKFGEI